MKLEDVVVDAMKEVVLLGSVCCRMVELALVLLLI